VRDDTVSNEDAVTEALKRDIAALPLTRRWRWGQPPVLSTIRLSRGAARLVQFPVPAGYWDEAAESPEAALTAAAAAFARMPPPPSVDIPAALYGVAFYSEAWAAPAGPDLTERARQAGGIVNLPDRYEARSIRAVDRTGTCYSLLRRRGDRQVGIVTCRSSDPAVRDSEVLCALISMTGTFLGVSL
jgi:hypothetical protein